MEITFANPSYLAFLISIPLLVISHFFTLRYLERRAVRFANFEALKRVFGSDRASIKNSTIISRNIPLLILRLGSLTILIFAAAGTTLWRVGEVNDVSYVVAVDASSSMLADDFSPNRLEAAKLAAVKFVEGLEGRTKVGVISFSGTSFIEASPTFDRDAALSAIEGIKERNVGGTDLGAAIVTGCNMLTSEASKAVILLTDGRSTVGVPVEQGILYAQQSHAAVFTIGVATVAGGRFLRTNDLSTLDEDSLMAISTSTGGEYFRAQSPDELVNAFQSIAHTSKQNYKTDLSGGLLLVAIGLLFIEWGLVTTRFKTLP